MDLGPARGKLGQILVILGLVATSIAFPSSDTRARLLEPSIIDNSVVFVQPYAPGPSLCQVQPLTDAQIDTLTHLSSSESIQNVTPEQLDQFWPGYPTRSIASQDVVNAVLEATIQRAACINAGDVLRYWNLYSVDYFSRGDGLYVDTTQLTGEPSPRKDADRVLLDGIVSVSMLPDGKVGAYTLMIDPLYFYPLHEFVIFSFEDGIWKVWRTTLI